MAHPVKSSASFQAETRVQQSVLTTLEKRVLHWLALRIPDRINSDHLTLLALFAMVSVGASYWLSRYTPVGLVLATFWLAVNWFGDSLDGTLARVRAQQRPRYGYYVDHVVDVVGVLFLFGGLGLSGYLHPAVAATLLIAYFLLSLEVYLATHSLGRFQMSFFGVGPTELRLVLAAVNVALLITDPPHLAGSTLTVLDAGALAGAAALVFTFVVSACRNTRLLYRAEPMPARIIR
jgi:phosphatidylglycerophosphate synthase